jgi:hypothetical protein
LRVLRPPHANGHNPLKILSAGIGIARTALWSSFASVCSLGAVSGPRRIRRSSVSAAVAERHRVLATGAWAIGTIASSGGLGRFTVFEDCGPRSKALRVQPLPWKLPLVGVVQYVTIHFGPDLQQYGHGVHPPGGQPGFLRCCLLGGSL